MAIENIEMKYKTPQTVSLTQRNLDKEWKKLEADPKLVEEIKARGFVNPLPILKTVGSGIDMEFVVVEGAKSLRAAQEAGLKEVWCFFVEGTEEVEDEVEETTDDQEEVVAATSEMQATPVYTFCTPDSERYKLTQAKAERIKELMKSGEFDECLLIVNNKGCYFKDGEWVEEELEEIPSYFLD